MVDIASALIVASNAIGLVKAVSDIDRDLSKAELKAKMADIYSSLADVKMALVDAETQNREKDQQIFNLKARAIRISETDEIDGFRYDIVDGSAFGLPYCPRCEVAFGGMLIRMMRRTKSYSRCPECDKSFNAGPNGRVGYDN